MSRKAKIIDDEIGGSEVKPDVTKTNSDGSKLRQYLNRLHKWQKKIDAIMDAAKKDCAPMRDEIKKTKKEAAELGFSRAEFNALYTLERKKLEIENIAANFDDEQTVRFEQYREQLELFDKQQAEGA